MHIKSKYILLVMALAATQVSLAQVELRQRYEDQTVYWKNNQLVRADELIPLNKFKQELLRFDDSRLHFEQYRKDNRVGWVFNSLALAAFLTPLFIDDRTAQGVLLGTGAVLTIPAFVFFNNGQNHVQKSVWYYNRDILLEP